LRVLGKSVLEEFRRTHPNSRAALKHWLCVTEEATWGKLIDVRATFRNADGVGPHVVFDIGGNNFRLIAAIDYVAQVVSVESVLTHSEYDKGRWKG